MFHDLGKDEGAGRTITLSAEDVKIARHLLRLLSGADLDRPRTRDWPEPEELTRSAFVARARDELSDRRRRAKIFGQSMFGEPAWQMLLVLYVSSMSGQRQTLGSVLRLSGSSVTTAKRWLDFLETRGLIARHPHPTDRRTDFVSLSSRGEELLDLYYSETLDSRL